jgi:hypothetical protein
VIEHGLYRAAWWCFGVVNAEVGGVLGLPHGLLVERPGLERPPP